MLPTIALIGRPNVGKSTLFNFLTRTREAIVADFPGLTRDRKYGRGKVGETAYLVVDTGGLSFEEDGIDALMARQTQIAIADSDVIFFMVDGRGGLTSSDQEIANQLRQLNKPVYLLVNKTDGVDEQIACADFYSLGLGEMYPVSATQGRHMRKLMNHVLNNLPQEVIRPEETHGVRIAVLGRPNVGKSTLINRLIGEERVVTYDMPGTTRDTVDVPFEYEGKPYTLIDTAGVRRRSKVKEAVEKFSVIKAIQAIEDSQVVILVMDAHSGISDQDVTLLGYILDAGRALLIAVNKWDGMDLDDRDQVKQDLDRKLTFIDYAEFHYISALHGTGVGHLFETVNKAYLSAMSEFKTQRLTQILEYAIAQHQPPLVRGHRIKLRYAHQGGKNPPLIIIHGNQTEAVPDAYTRYLMSTYRKQLRLTGTPVSIEYKTGKNPFKDKRNKLSPRQVARKKRLMKWVKSKK
ncbi:GTP-binding protein EngA [hydrothermal vent metagenome]|uniref:GTPase Der n=1 Tax=hydrothermal vent metagenome TaxID=652676 RepID=A0A3B0ZJS9_9ZZZZ